MPRTLTSFSMSLCLATVALAAPLAVQARTSNAASCRIAIDYQLNNNAPESYRKDFIVEPGKAFNDDFSTQIRTKLFNASAAQEAGRLVVSFDYFNDAGVFHSIGFNSRLTLHEGRSIETTSGSNSFSTTLGVAGNHVTNYTLSCQRL